MPNGTIKRLVRDRGFGFIRDEGGQEWFFHRSSVQGNFDQFTRRPARQLRRGTVAEGPARGQRPQRRVTPRTKSGTVLLFDIDGTLVLTGGAGGRAMTRAFEDLYGVRERVRGRPLQRPHRRVDSRRRPRPRTAIDDEALSQFKPLYLDYLAEELHKPGPRKGVMPGVAPAARRARAAVDDVFLALLTGNFERGAQTQARTLRSLALLRVRCVRRHDARTQRPAAARRSRAWPAAAARRRRRPTS